MENKKVVFISFPYSRDPKKGEELSLLGGLYVRREGKTPFSPVFNFQNFFDNGNEYDAVLEDCKVILSRCDEALFIEDAEELSKGQMIELAAAQGMRKKVLIVESATLKDLIRFTVTKKGKEVMSV